MYQIIRTSGLAWLLMAPSTCALADEAVLFNGKDLEGWTFEVSEGEENARPVDEVWVVQQGLLISTGSCTGFLKHAGEFEDYVLTLEWRSMQLRGNGVAVSGSGSLFVHTSDEKGSFQRPKSVEIGLFNDPGSVYFRDVDPFGEQEWAFRAPDFADDVEKEMGEWNHLKVICRGDRLTIFLNGTPVNQVEGLNRTKGAVALKSQRAAFQAPSYYRNIRVQPLSDASAAAETAAAARLAAFKVSLAKQQAAEEARRRKEEAREKLRAAELEREWEAIDVPQEIEFTAEARRLPFPADARDLEFDATFGDVELVSGSSLAVLTMFYRTEMAKRGWQEAEKERDEESVGITFRQGEAQVELTLEQDSDGVEVSMDGRGLSFEGTNDPAGLVALGLPQPRAYVFLQKEIALPPNARDVEFDLGNRYLYKSGLRLQEAFDHVGQQLRAKGYRETRRPIVTADRRYTEFAKGRIEVGVNIFSHEGGSRAILTYEEN